MSTWVPVNKERHAGQGWRRFSDYGFAATSPVVDIALAETRKVAAAMPFAFRQVEEGRSPAAIMGLQREVNLFVAPDKRWLARYVPSLLRSYPFRFVPAPGGGFALCLDDAMVAPSAAEGEPIFTEDGTLAPRVEEVVELLRQIEASRLQARQAADALAAHGLLVPLVQVVEQNGPPQALEGFWTVDEKALEGVSDEACATLHRHGALRLAYDQLSSLEQWLGLVSLKDMKRRHEEELEKRAAAIYATPEDGDLEIDWSRFKV